jgi:UPF0176 protein
MKQKTIISFYKFTSIKYTKELQQVIKEQTSAKQIKGTIILASEGINGMISGSTLNIKQIQEFLCSQKELGEITFKESYYDDISFRRMLVKVKKEIITMRKDVEPLTKTGKNLKPKDFKTWLDQNKDIHIIDTRNDYEVKMGTFKNAHDPKIKSFTEFTSYIDNNKDKFKGKPIVTFCTGGVRCEKATAYMMDKGLNDVYQLQGGIIKYFEETNPKEDDYWQGDCIVFDKRKAITPQLTPSEKMICYICLEEMQEKDKAKEPGPGGDQCQKCCDMKTKNRFERTKRKLLKKSQSK